MKKFIKYRILAIWMALHTILLSACGSNVTNNSSNSKNKEYEPGEHILLEVDRNYNPFWGKNKKFSLESPKGYKIIDYDYDKTENFEFETILYENVVPVTKSENDFGTPIEEIENNNSNSNVYDIGEHVLVKIVRDLNLFIGYNGKAELEGIDGYELLDYDYDKNENFEFQTYVYVNNKKIKADDINTFGNVIEEEKILRK